MKPEKILEVITRAADALPDDDQKLFQFIRKAPYLKSVTWSTGAILGELANALEREIGTNAAKRSGRLTQRRALDRIYKAAVAKNADRRPDMAGTFEQGGARCLCDGYLAIRIISQDIKMPASAPKNGEPLDLLKVFSGLSSRTPIALPAADWLKAQIKIAVANSRAQGVKPSNIHPIAKVEGEQGTVYISAQYLLDALEALPKHTKATVGNYFSPLYIESADGDAVVLPVRYDSEKINHKEQPLIDCTAGTEGEEHTA